MRKININRQLMGLEDLTFGVGTETQTRAGQQVTITKINAGNLPFDETRSLLEWAQSVDLPTFSAMSDELIAIYNNLTMLGNVEGNLVMLNAVEDSLTMLTSIYTNISKIQTVDTNMAKIQNIDTYMPELSTIYTNLAMLQAVYNNLTMLNNVEDNLVAINSVNSNLTQLLAIYTQVIPNLTELLQVNENAAQVAADKITVNADKLIVAQNKADVSVMKAAVESIYDSFDDRFLGAKTTDPLLDNDGNALLDGALYFNSSVNALKVYSLDNTTWYTIPQIYLSGLLDVQLTSITTGDILNWNGTKWVNTKTPKFSTMQLTGGTGTEGTLSWNTDEGTVDIILPNGSILQVGQEGIRKVRNGTASTITNGTVVMFDGTIGNSGRIKVKPFTGGFNEALYVYGIATQDILAGADGIITTEGKIRGINTTGSLVGETWVDGDILYAKPINAGALTKVVPNDSQLKMVMASVIHAHTSGTLEIRFTPINENTWYTKVQADNLLALKVTKVTSTDNAIVRFDGVTGDVQNSGVSIDDNGNLTAASGSILLLHNESHAQLIGLNTDVIYGNIGAFATKFYTDGAERMKISSNGNILVGTTTDNGVDKLQVNGSIKYVRKSGAFVGETIDIRTITSNASTQLGTFRINNSSVIVEIQSSSGLHSFPIYGYGGVYFGWQFNYMNPQTAVWSHSLGIEMSFTEQGASPNTYFFSVNAATGIVTIQATTYNSGYTVTITRI